MTRKIRPNPQPRGAAMPRYRLTFAGAPFAAVETDAPNAREAEYEVYIRECLILAPRDEAELNWGVVLSLEEVA